MKRAAIFGASGAIGSALVQHYSDTGEWEIHAYSRSAVLYECASVYPHCIDYLDENALQEQAICFSSADPLDLVIIATGILHQDHIQPEKALRMLSAENLRYLFEVNTVVPGLIAKHFAPRLRRDAKSSLAFLTARAGSISDNEMGGWHSYRASKAALNMLAKNISIEVGRTNAQAVVTLIHPGVVDSELSKPFKRSLPEGKLLQPETAAQQIASLLDGLTAAQSGQILELDGEVVAP